MAHATKVAAFAHGVPLHVAIVVLAKYDLSITQSPPGGEAQWFQHPTHENLTSAIIGISHHARHKGHIGGIAGGDQWAVTQQPLAAI